jgi:hypothetical protein
MTVLLNLRVILHLCNNYDNSYHNSFLIRIFAKGKDMNDYEGNDGQRPAGSLFDGKK